MSSNTFCHACDRSFQDQHAYERHCRQRHPPRPEDLASPNITNRATPPSPPARILEDQAIAGEPEVSPAETPKDTLPPPNITPRRIITTSPSLEIRRPTRFSHILGDVAADVAAASALLDFIANPSNRRRRSQPSNDSQDQASERPQRRRRTRSVHWADGEEAIPYAPMDPPAAMIPSASIGACVQVATAPTVPAALSVAPRKLSLSQYTARKRAAAQHAQTSAASHGGNRGEQQPVVADEKTSPSKETSSDRSGGQVETEVQEGVTVETTTEEAEQPEEDDSGAEDGEIQE